MGCNHGKSEGWMDTVGEIAGVFSRLYKIVCDKKPPFSHSAIHSLNIPKKYIRKYEKIISPIDLLHKTDVSQKFHCQRV